MSLLKTKFHSEIKQMVNTLSHLGIGVLIALVLGFKGRKRDVLAFLSILPDLDFIPYALFVLVSGSASHETRNQLFYLFGHREFMHSIFFILVVTLLIWLKTKDRLFTTAGFAALFPTVTLIMPPTGKCVPSTHSAQIHPSWELYIFSIPSQTSFPCCPFLSYL